MKFWLLTDGSVACSALLEDGGELAIVQSDNESVSYHMFNHITTLVNIFILTASSEMAGKLPLFTNVFAVETNHFQLR